MQKAFMKYRDLTLHEPPVAKCPGHDKKEGMPCKNPNLYRKPPLRFFLWLKIRSYYLYANGNRHLAQHITRLADDDIELDAIELLLIWTFRKFISQGSREGIGLFRPFPTDNAAKLFF
jgi:hypothetical protein